LATGDDQYLIRADLDITTGPDERNDEVKSYPRDDQDDNCGFTNLLKGAFEDRGKN